MPPSPRTNPLANWSTVRVATAATVLVLVTALATYLVTSPNPDNRPVPAGAVSVDDDALLEPLDRLARTSAAATAFLTFGSMAAADAATGTPTTLVPRTTAVGPTSSTSTVPPGASSTPRIELESGVVDFANRSAVMGTPGRPVPPVVVVDNVTYVDWDSSRVAGSTPRAGWVQMPPEVGAHTSAGTAAFLISIVDRANTWVEPSSVTANGDLLEARIDDARVRADIESVLASMDPDAATRARTEITDGTRALPTGRIQVRVGDDGLPVDIRIEIATVGQLGTMSWSLSDFGTTVTAAVPPEDNRISYEDFSADLRSLVDNTGQPQTSPDDALESVTDGRPVPSGPAPPVDPSSVTADPNAPASPEDAARIPPRP